MKKKKIMIISSITLAILLLLGVSYAYFAARVLGSESVSTMAATSGKMDIVYDGGSPLLEAHSIAPNPLPFITKNFTITGTNNSGQTMPYSIKLVIDTNTFSDNAISYTLEGTNTGNNGEIAEDVLETGIVGTTSQTIGSGYFQNADEVVHTYVLKLYFKDTNIEQNDDMEKAITAHLEIEATSSFIKFNQLILANNGGQEAIDAKSAPSYSAVAPAITSYNDEGFGANYTRTFNSTSAEGESFTYGYSYTYNKSNGLYSITNTPGRAKNLKNGYSDFTNAYVPSYYGSYSGATTYWDLNSICLIHNASYSSLTMTYQCSLESTNNQNLNDKGVYSAPDDYGTSYYFRGAVDNNWVYFAGIYWRIIRINGDGSIRMIYSGTIQPSKSTSITLTGNGTQISLDGGTTLSYKFNEEMDDNMYVGYKYQSNVVHGLQSSSAIKNTLSEWYTSTFSPQEISKIADSVYCNDRSSYTNDTGTTIGGGTGTATSYYGGYVRNFMNSSPILNCPTKSDAFTVNDLENGNGQSDYPVGLLTIDEATMAGIGKQTKGGNKNNYLYTNMMYWSMSPAKYNLATMNAINRNGIYATFNTNQSVGVRPVISLKSNVQVSGSGTWNDPYVVQE